MTTLPTIAEQQAFLRSILAQTGMTRSKLAAELGVVDSTVDHWLASDTAKRGPVMMSRPTWRLIKSMYAQHDDSALPAILKNQCELLKK